MELRPQMVAMCLGFNSDIEVGRCTPCEDGTQLWYYQIWGASALYPRWGEDGLADADEALQAAMDWIDRYTSLSF